RTGLLGKHHPAPAPSQPCHRHLNKFYVSHTTSLKRNRTFEKCPRSYRASYDSRQETQVCSRIFGCPFSICCWANRWLPTRRVPSASARPPVSPFLVSMH